MRKFAAATAFVITASLALAACGKKEDEVQPTNNLVEPPVENVIIEEPEAPEPEPANNVVAAPAPAPTISEQQQIEDDAAATGMTARIDREGADEGASATE